MKNKDNGMPGNKGLLISFEGSEGSGKSTQIALLMKRIEATGRDVVVTREPGGTEIGEEIRHLLKHSTAGKGMTPAAELLLFSASRAQLVHEVMIPSLEEGKIILCDRFLDSTTVYQGMARKISRDPVNAINHFAAGDLVPDLTIVLDVPAETGLSRIRHRASDLPDRMEQENVAFYRKVREGYLVLAKSFPERFIVIDGTPPIEEVAEKIWNAISPLLNR
ncbi:MAG TPA: dTMP kinase [Opitutales bacterium]|nr:dTMP kinase [Opitutales bacterium]